MGWSGKFANIISWYKKFLVYVGVSHVLYRGMRDILYIEQISIYRIIFLYIEILYIEYTSKNRMLLYLELF